MGRSCAICDKQIPTVITIDGRKRSLANRKNCLDCSPFKNKTGNGMQYSKWSEDRKARHRAVSAAKGLKRKKELVRLAGGHCIICGYNTCLRALTFHHRDPANKSFELNVSDIKSKNWDVVLNELAKCDLLCIRCHLEIEDQPYSHYIQTEVASKVKILHFCNQCKKSQKYKSSSGLCVDCSRLNSRTVTRPELTVLQSQIKALGYCGTARLYSVSDNSIRKWLKQASKEKSTML
jgi:uncharacterized CHY-type Zn-finger protein